MEVVPVLVEGITDKAFLERLSELEKRRIDFSKARGGGQDQAKQDFASQIKARVKVILCLDIDDKTPEGKFAEVKDYLEEKGIPIDHADPAKGTIGTAWGEVLFVPFGLWSDNELGNLHITRHSFEDYLIKIALADLKLMSPGIGQSLKKCLEQIVSEYGRKGCPHLSSAQVYQFMKPFLGLPKHETRSISTLLSKVNQDVVLQTTAPLVRRLNSFLASVGGPA